MALVNRPRYECDICKIIEGDKVRHLQVTLAALDDEGDEVEAEVWRADFCPRCKTRLLTSIKTGTTERKTRQVATVASEEKEGQS